MSERVFFSYSWKQKVLGANICDSLISNGVSIFRDELNVSPGENFKERIIKEIKGTDFLIVVDSSSTRTSEWVPFEIKQFLKHREAKNLLVCLAEETGEWRNEREFFKGFNNLTYFDFVPNKDGFYHNGKFRRSMELLCGKLNISFSEEVNLPRVQDLTKEISFITNNSSEHELRQLIVRDFQQILSLDRFNSKTIISRLENLCQDCQQYDLDVSSPTIALCLAKGKLGLHDDAYIAAKNLTSAGSKDPRVWHVLAGARFKRKGKDKRSDYLQCIDDYKSVIQLINWSENSEHEKQRHWAVANLVVCLLKVGEIENAHIHLSELTMDQRNSTRLSKAFSSIYEKMIEDSVFEGQMYKASKLAHSLFELFDIYSIAVRGLILILLFTGNNRLDVKSIVERIRVIRSIPPITSLDYYYKGLLHYLIGVNDELDLYSIAISDDQIEEKTEYHVLTHCYIVENREFLINLKTLAQSVNESLPSYFRF